jgi:transcriptional regulator with XRE-family HTH domain
MTDLRKVLASNMKRYRKARGLSQAKLAEIIDISENYIAMIESARRFPSLSMLERIARALQVDPLELFSINPAKSPEKKALQAKILADIEQILTLRLEEMGA